jgi:hypothetical protein
VEGGGQNFFGRMGDERGRLDREGGITLSAPAVSDTQGIGLASASDDRMLSESELAIVRRLGHYRVISIISGSGLPGKPEPAARSDNHEISV